MKTIGLSLALGTAALIAQIAHAQTQVQIIADDDKQMSMPNMYMSHMDHSAPEADQNGMSEHHHPMRPSDCEDMEAWDYSMGMCMPLAMAGMPMKMLMVRGNAFATQAVEGGPRGRSALTVPDMFMADLGSSVGDRHYVNVDFMGTFERWTYPTGGYPELLQIGEADQDHKPYLDAQHPHSSPIMGLTLSDTISFGAGKDHLKLFAAPRGESTDGPIAFMHRPTGMINPDAPLGHHIGQDVGHITSTVVGAALRMNSTTLEASAFNGTEPEPTQVDLPIGEINSYAARLTQEFTPHFFVMMSAAFVKNPEPSDPILDHVWRYSASFYNDHMFENGWMTHNAFIWGLINYYDNASALNSFAEEFWVHKNSKNIWSRVEVLQRTSGELEITSAQPNDPRWVTALTLGYTHKVAKWDSMDVGLGGSLTKDILAAEFRDAYGGDPLTGKVFIQVGGMKMWDL
jgi:hypothetical protein